MASSDGNDIWLKAEIALKRVASNTVEGLNQGNLYAGHENDLKQSPSTVAECHFGEVETRGQPTGNWRLRCVVTTKTKLSDETGQDNSGRFRSILNTLLSRNATELLSSAEERFTVFFFQVTDFTKSIRGDELVCELNCEMTCCGSVIA